jgi:hypothetical protein
MGLLPKIFPADEVIETYELMFLILFAVGLNSFVTWITFQYPFASVTICAFGILLLWLAKMVRKKRDKVTTLGDKR